MSNVYCDNIDCLNNNGTMCEKSTITISNMDFESCCIDYASYYVGSEYQEVFWISAKSKRTDGKVVRMLRKGKKLELFGMIFYTRDDVRYPEKADLTEARTGVHCGTIKRLYDDTDSIIKQLAEYPDVMSYDLYEDD